MDLPTGADRGRFIVLEGGEASGKTTQARRLADALHALATREPGGTEVGARIRAILLDPETGDLDARAEALLVAGDRAQHVRAVIEPALAAGRHVVSDRYTGSSLAYQGYGRGLAVDEVAYLSDWATGGLEADLVIWLSVPDSVAAERLGTHRDRLEREGADFHQRVADGFARLAQAEPARWTEVDGAADEDDVADAIRTVVHDKLGL